MSHYQTLLHNEESWRSEIFGSFWLYSTGRINGLRTYETASQWHVYTKTIYLHSNKLLIKNLFFFILFLNCILKVCPGRVEIGGKRSIPPPHSPSHNSTNFQYVATFHDNSEIKLHVHGILQTAESSWEFLKVENKQIKPTQNNSYG